MRAEPVVSRTLSDVIEAIGNISANESVTLTAKVTDTVSKVRFEDGNYVDEGSVIVELTNAEETALLAEAEANVNEAERQYNRLQNLYQQRTVSASARDEAKANLSAAKGRFDSIVARLNDRLVRAPFAGLLGFRQVSAGSLITPGAAIATLDDIATVKLDFNIPEVHLAQLKPGLKLRAFSVAFPDATFAALVQTIDTRIDPVTRSARVRAHISNDGLKLRPGMLMTVALQTRERIALAVPEEALVTRSGSSSVYVVTVDDNSERTTAALRAVKTGGRYEGYVEVISGVAEGELVVTDGTIKVRDGAPIRILGAPDSAPITG